MKIIGELINGTRAKPKEAIAQRNADYIADLARRQDEAGAHFIDANPGTSGEAEITDMLWLAETIQAVTDKPLSFDSPSVRAIEAALDAYTGSALPLINSITYEREKLDALIGLVAETGANVVALAMGDDGMPSDSLQREETALRLIDTLTARGIDPERIYLDPVIVPLGTCHETGTHVLSAVRAIRRQRPECHITCGLSNISYGLPHRKLVNRVFLVQCMVAGLDSAIIDPLEPGIMAELAAAEALLGNDEWCMNYITLSRSGALD
jgi:5-methyltetrahydrofolate--homocysteine methyltransferase